ncbi:hypothetical protein NDU88_006972 [Pleurodeles waltl]|uniref:Uncharacterized protein n=1 Tax=Pleurodeles waltl TaxID=8319 RepID=A0AAV7WHV5_PLEWA|nr:hypothetical protein NDU88_006972 [Pleurodeles waltl]
MMKRRCCHGAAQDQDWNSEPQKQIQLIEKSCLERRDGTGIQEDDSLIHPAQISDVSAIARPGSILTLIRASTSSYYWALLENDAARRGFSVEEGPIYFLSVRSARQTLRNHPVDGTNDIRDHC